MTEMTRDEMIERLTGYGMQERKLRAMSLGGLKIIHDKYFPEFAVTDEAFEKSFLVLASGDHAELTDLGDYQNEFGEVPENVE